MIEIRYYDRSGIPMTADDWRRAFSRPRHIGRTKVTDSADPATSFDVSTVWLGIDHSFGSGPPLIFETKVFAEGSGLDEACERYSTEQDALLGHRAMVSMVSAEMTDPSVIDVEP